MKHSKMHWLAALVLAMLMIFSSTTALADTLRYGDKGTEVKELQTRLKELGYYTRTIDGVYGSGTYKAIKAFQERNGLTVDGVTGTATLKLLNSSSARGATDEKVDTTEDGTLRVGSKGEAVKAVQRRLKELGYYKNSIDGSYGNVTASAVKAFQTKNGLTADGVCGTATLNKLNSSSAKGANDSNDAEEDDDDTLRVGSKGEAVKAVQRRLKELGYYKSSVDGSYGNATAAAVKAFQTKNGLTADGVCGPDTLEKLNSSSAKGANDSDEDDEEDDTLRVGSKGEAVKAVQRRLSELGYYKNSIDGSYGNVTASAVKVFQSKNGLTADGVCDSDTLSLLNSSSAKDVNGKTHDASEVTLVTERLDWFKDGVDTFPRKAIIQIKDCQTGLIFNAQVLYGSNHLDVEPLTAADTQILLKINGGVDFSYRRRSMLVKYDGHVYAASIYSEPHGDETITDNNFDGQFCLHFYGSKTHGTDRVDEDHKECEERALKYTW